VRTISLAWKSLLRDWRAGELRLLGAAITIAVASLTTAGFFTDRVKRAVELQATELLAADLVLASNNPVAPSLIGESETAGLEHTRTVTFRSMAVAGDVMELAEVKAVEDGYPIRGRLRTAADLFGDEQDASGIPAPGTVWVDSRLLQALGTGVGGEVMLGERSFPVSRILTYEPDRGGDLFNIAPRLMMNLADLPATGLVQPGSRVQYRLLLGGNPGQITAFRQRIADAPDRPSVQGIRDERPELRNALERAEQFLGLAVLVSVALCGLAIAMAAQRHALRHFDACALMRCFGAGQSQITGIHVWQLILMAALFSCLGVLIGYGAQEILATLLSGLAARELPAPSLVPLWAGLIAGNVTVLGFALPQIWRLRAVPPLRVFRRELAPVPPRGLTVYGSAILILALLTPWQAGNARLTAYVFVGLLLAAGLFMIGALGLIRASAALRGRVGVAWRYGLANIARRARGSMAQIVGIGIGATIMLVLTLVRTDLMVAWQDRLPPQAPNYFLINIQPDQVGDLHSFLDGHGVAAAELHPMVRGRLVRVNERTIHPDDYAEPRAQRLASREFNLSWAEHMQQDNRLKAGRWWDGKGSEALLSVEDGISETLGLRLGDRITWSIAGQEVTGVVGNLREVDWDSFNVNFFVVASPGTLENFPSTYITAFHLADGERPLLVELVRAFPSVTVIDVAAILSQVRSIMQQVSRTMEFVFAFTLLAGLIVLFAALQATHDERHVETAILRSLGADRFRVLTGLAAEFLALGCIAGLLAAAAAAGIQWALAELVFRLPYSFNPWIWLFGPAACMLIVTAAGLIGTFRILSTPPIAALRSA
jgi:putative ABC transport system permease protein